MTTYAKGDPVDYKAGPGLGGWRRGEYVDRVEYNGRVLHLVEDGSLRFTVPDSKIRAPRSTASLVKARDERRRRPSSPTTIPPRPLDGYDPPAVPAVSAPTFRPRARPVRSRSYLSWVATKPCASCSAPGPSDPHHFGPRGYGEKTDDLRAVPLCRRCHDAFHSSTPESPVGAIPPENRLATRLRLLERQVDLLLRWIAER